MPGPEDDLDPEDERRADRGAAAEDEPSVTREDPEVIRADLDVAHEGADVADDDGEELSLEDLSAAYARAAAEHDPESFASPAPESESSGADDDAAHAAEEASDPADEADSVVTPEAIIEAALFVGHPENHSLSEQRLASLIRDFSPEEVIEVIDQLNESYRQHRQALRIIREDHGYRMTIAPEIESIRQQFFGKVREARLNQLAVEVLSLVAYQPGINAQTVQDQRGRDCGAVLNQLVRRRLLEMRRVKPPDGGRAVPHYYPTERFLVLFGLDSLDDLPQVEETNLPIDLG